MKPLLSLVILNHNGRKIIEKTLPLLKKIKVTGKIKVIFIENGSTDDSFDYVKKNFPSFKIIRNKKNLGTPGFNSALKYLRGKYSFLATNDLIYDPKCLQKMIDFLEKNPLIAHVVPIVYDFETKKEISNFSIFSRSFNSVGEPAGKRKEPYEICTSLIGMFRTSFLKKLDYIVDPTIFLYGEDDEFGLRLRLLGKRTMVLPNAITYHYDITKTQKGHYYPKHVYYVEKHHLIAFFSLPSTFHVILWFPYVALVRLLAILVDIVKLRPLCAIARVQAILWILCHPFLLAKKRIEKQTIRKMSDSYVFALCDEKKFLKKIILGHF